ncbi:MAG: glycogen debranching protein [Bacteroidota bacterium]
MRILLILPLLFLWACQQDQATQDITSMKSLLANSPSLPSKEGSEGNSPFVTAGDRVYMVGDQDGRFSPIGWHIKDEMGGIWNHPIKLMDGFSIRLLEGEQMLNLGDSSTVAGHWMFTNYPMANTHEFSFPERELAIARTQFVPDGKEGIVIEYQIENTSDTSRDMILIFHGQVDLRPTWLGERTDMDDRKDEISFDEKGGKFIAKDLLNPWFVVCGANLSPLSMEEKESPREGRGTAGELSYQLSLKGGEKKLLRFVIAGSYQKKEQALMTYEDLHENWASYLESKKKRYAALAQQSKLTLPDKDIQQAFEWLKYNCDWLVRDVPEVGRGMTAGLPDYPWWFGVDSEYGLKGYMAIGQDDVVYDTIELLDSVSQAVNGNGRIIHEMSTNGAVFNPGNINETPQFASLIWEIYQWNGDKAFLEKYYGTVKKGLEWLLDENDDNGNLFPDGFGMMEIHGMNSEMIDVAAYTQRAFADAALMAKVLGDAPSESKFQRTAEQLRAKINTEFWSEEFGSYGDFIGTDQQALELIEDAIVRADTLGKPWSVEELEALKKQILANPSREPRPFVMHHNWVVNTPLEMGIADQKKAEKALESAKLYTNPYGVFVTGIDRDESAGKGDDFAYKKNKTFSYTGAVMTLPTGVVAISEGNYGRSDQALDYLKRMTRSFSYKLPGSMYEVSPDYGMFTQAWTIYSYSYPIIQQFFGLQPDAAEKRIFLSPAFPSTWDEASLENVKIGENEVSLYVKRVGEEIEIELRQTKGDWIVELPTNLGEVRMSNNAGKQLSFKAGEPQQERLELSGEKIMIYIK